MRTMMLLAGGFAVPILTTGMLVAAEPAPNAGKNVQALLQKLNDAFLTKDADTMRLLMSKDHVAILARGERQTREGQFNALNELDLTHYAMHDVRIAQPANDTVIFTYQANQKGTWKGKPLPSSIMVSAVWHRQNGQWQEVLYQETPLDRR